VFRRIAAVHRSAALEVPLNTGEPTVSDEARVTRGTVDAVPGTAQLRTRGSRPADTALEALRVSEGRYRTLFDSIDEGVSTIDLIVDNEGRSVDWVCVDANRALIRMTGLAEDIVGKRGNEYLGGIDQTCFDRFDRVARTGEPERQEYAFGRWFTLLIARAGGAGSRRLVCVLNDITDHKRREANLSFLNEVSRDLVRLANIDETMKALGAKIGRHLDVPLVAFAEVDEHADAETLLHEWHRADMPGLAGRYRVSDFAAEDCRRAWRAGETVVVPDSRTDSRMKGGEIAALGIASHVSVPVVRDERQFLVAMYDKVPRDWRDDEVELMREVTTRISARVEQLRGEGQIKALFKRLLSVQEGERQRIARDIHDQLGQQMTALRMNLEGMRMRADPDSVSVAQAERTQRLAEDLDRSIDFLTWELRSAALDRLGLSAALRNLVTGWSARFGIAAEFEAVDTESLRLPRDREANLYRIAQEALHNVVKHARASYVAVYFERRDQNALLTIEDNGCGFVVPKRREQAGHGGFGLVSMRERAVLIDGSLDIQSQPDRGTVVLVQVPIAAPESPVGG
jgi:signal transduction histidine kinase